MAAPGAAMERKAIMIAITISLALLAAGTLVRIVMTASRLLIGLATHPIITIIGIINALASLAAGCSLLALIATLALCDTDNPRFLPTAIACAVMTVLCAVTAAAAERTIAQRTER